MDIQNISTNSFDSKVIYSIYYLFTNMHLHVLMKEANLQVLCIVKAKAKFTFNADVNCLHDLKFTGALFREKEQY